MKCTNCGKNNAMYHFRYNINGNVTTAHLCPECAAKMGEDAETDVGYMLGDAFSDLDSVFDGMFDGFFGGFFGRRSMNPFYSFGLPSMLMPRLTFAAPAESGAGRSATGTAEKPVQVDAELSRRREINELREQMRSAAEAEDYETAARIRDRIKEMEK